RDKGVLPGDRAPDAPVTGAAGQATRLFQLFRGTHWTLLGYEPGTAAIAPRRGLRIHVVGGDIRDTWGHVRDAYGLEPGEWALIRPDGYVAAVTGTAGLGSIESLLDRVGVRPVH
ncbi:MAG: 2-polyprenyl-6-methoxyphenol hydroxylase, partial [Actinomycetes bacterium]